MNTPISLLARRRLALAGAMLLASLGSVSWTGPAQAQPLATAPTQPGWQILSLSMQGERIVAEQAPSPAQAELRVPASQTLMLDRQGRYRLVTSSEYPGPIRFNFLQLGLPEGGVTVDLLKWRNGTEIDRKSAEGARADLAELQFLAPAFLLELARAQGLSPAQGRLEFKDLAGRPAQLIFDANSGALQAALSATRRYDYADAQTLAEGLAQPRRIRESRGDRPLIDWQVQAQLLPLAVPGLFELPAGYVEASASGPLRATPIGPGSYRVDGSPSRYHSAFTIGERGIVVYDAPVSVAEGQAVRALIEQLAPGRPITHLVVSHAHRDHVAGLPAFMNESLQIFAGAGASQALRRQHGEAVAARVKELTQGSELDLGDRRIRLLPLPNAHAAESLLAFDSGSGVLFQGDLFYIPDVGPVPAAFDMSQALDQLIRREQLPVQLIVGVHGRSGTPQELALSLKLAERMRRLQPDAHKH